MFGRSIRFLSKPKPVVTIALKKTSVQLRNMEYTHVSESYGGDMTLHCWRNWTFTVRYLTWVMVTHDGWNWGYTTWGWAYRIVGVTVGWKCTNNPMDILLGDMGIPLCYIQYTEPFMDIPSSWSCCRFARLHRCRWYFYHWFIMGHLYIRGLKPLGNLSI